MPRFANPLKKTKVLNSTFGQSIEYPGRPSGGELIFVHTPPLLVREAIAMGLAGEDELEEDAERTLTKKPTDPEKLKAELFDAFDLLVADNTPTNFTAAGTPKVNAVEKLTGFGVDQPEMNTAWRAYQLERGEREQQQQEDRAEAKKAVAAAKDAANKK